MLIAAQVVYVVVNIRIAVVVLKLEVDKWGEAAGCKGSQTQEIQPDAADAAKNVGTRNLFGKGRAEYTAAQKKSDGFQIQNLVQCNGCAGTAEESGEHGTQNPESLLCGTCPEHDEAKTNHQQCINMSQELG